MDTTQTTTLPATIKAAPQKILSVLFAHGWNNHKIKEHLETLGNRASMRSIQLLRESPLMILAVEEVERDLFERAVSDVADIRQRLQAEALPSIKVLTQVRDGEIAGDDAGNRRGAANDLLGYTVPKKTQSESTSKHILELGSETIKAMQSVLIETGHIPALLADESVIDVEPETLAEGEVIDDPADSGQENSNLVVAKTENTSKEGGSAGISPASKNVVSPDFYKDEDRDFDSDNG